MSKQELSPIEMSFWYQYIFERTSDANNIVHRLTLRQTPDKESLQSIFNRLIQIHPSLRTNFREENGTPFRIVHDQIDLQIINGSSLGDEEILAQIRRPFDLSSDNLLRITFVNKSGKVTLFLASHHIVFDAVSWNILLNDLSNLLDENITKDRYSQAIFTADPRANNYWVERLNGVEGRVSFEQNTATPPQRYDDTAATWETYEYGPIIEKLLTVGKKWGVSPNSLCMAILGVALSKLTDSNKFIISTPVTTREDKSIDHIGAHINVLPVVIDIGQESFSEYAKELAAQIWSAIDNRQFSLIELMSKVSSGYRTDDQGIYNVMAEYVPPVSLPGNILEDELIPNRAAKLDFILSIIAGTDGHKIIVEYDKSKLNSGYIEQIVRVFGNIVTVILNKPDKPIQDIPLIDKHEANALIEIGQGPTKDIEPPFIWNKFKAAVQANPDHIAIRDKSGTISYQELFDMTCKHAALLSQNGAKKGSVVGVHMERSAEYMASMLAIWSHGAIYVPLDTKQPASRLKFMIEQASISIVMTDGRTIPNTLVSFCDVKEGSKLKPLDSSYEPDGEDVAYIIFTSGSTGTPKGVMIEHRGFLNHLEIMINDLGLVAEDAIAQTAPVSFDISVWQLVCAFLIGASVIVVDHDEMIDPDLMYKTIAENDISVLEVVPSLLSGYLSAEDSNPRLRGVLGKVNTITTGEAISYSVVKQWITHYPDRPLLNAYGPAEASDDTHFFDILPESVDEKRSIPIGRSLLNIQTYIVNHEMQLCPKGVIGEICIGGVSVSQGYIGNSELTAKSFLPNPFDRHNTRLYRTGDYGRWREDNLLEYHGRRDHQVKVRGQRLELGEVEDRLKEVSGVKDAAVIAEKSPSGARLRGFVVSNMPGLNIESLREELQNALPEYMIPWKLELIEALPRSANGKLDRRELENHQSKTGPIKISVPTSFTLSEILRAYSTVLNTSVYPESNYFDLGGDSLHSMKIVALLEESNVRVGIRDILTYQTPQDLAAMLQSQSKEDSGDLVPLTGPTPIQNYYFENAGQEYRDNGEVQAAVIAIDDSVALNERVLLKALQEIMERHQEFGLEGGSAPSLYTSANTDDPRLLVKEMRKTISLKNPLIGCILSLKKNNKRVILAAHHLAIDFYSWKIIHSELNAILQNNALMGKDKALKYWWSKALTELDTDSERQEEAKIFWKAQGGQPSTLIATGQTRSYSYAYTLTDEITRDLTANGISLESFSHYLISKAYLSATGDKDFSYNAESSLRSIDNTGTLNDGIGWMTYLFPFTITEQMVESTSLTGFDKRYQKTVKAGYEYGLLRYNISRAEFKDDALPVWTVNYLGKNMNDDESIMILKVDAYKEKPFIELDICLDTNALTFQYSHNTKLTKKYFDAIDKELQKLINFSADHSQHKKAEVKLSPQRQNAILERLKNANRH